MVSGAHGSSSVVPVISAISECGFLNSTPAHTPSAPAPRPRTCDNRWLSHRSTPRAGTRTSSEANGSGSGCGEERAEAVGQKIGAFSAVQMKGHRVATLGPPPDNGTAFAEPRIQLSDPRATVKAK